MLRLDRLVPLVLVVELAGRHDSADHDPIRALAIPQGRLQPMRQRLHSDSREVALTQPTVFKSRMSHS